MKKLVAILLLALTATTAMAQHHYHGSRHGHWHHRGHNSWSWVVPAVIGGAVVYGVTRPAPVVIEQPPIVYTPPPVPVVQAVCTRYIYQDQYGQTIREETRCN